MGEIADDIIGSILDPLCDEEEWQRLNDEDDFGPPFDPECPYCGHRAELVSSTEVYGQKGNYGKLWLCRPCKAWVGCHKGTEKPLGRLANAELRRAKMAAHAAFDPLWKDHPDPPWGKPGDRRAAYTWLADRLSILPRNCHIGMMGVEMCEYVVIVCEPYTSRLEEEDWKDTDGVDAKWETE